MSDTFCSCSQYPLGGGAGCVKLGAAFQKLWPDLLLHVETEQFATHRRLLAYHSAYFRDFFRSIYDLFPDKRESALSIRLVTGSVDTISAEMFSRILHWMYTDRIDLTPETAAGIFLATRKLGIWSLLETARRFIRRYTLSHPQPHQICSLLANINPPMFIQLMEYHCNGTQSAEQLINDAVWFLLDKPRPTNAGDIAIVGVVKSDDGKVASFEAHLNQSNKGEDNGWKVHAMDEFSCLNSQSFPTGKPKISSSVNMPEKEQDHNYQLIDEETPVTTEQFTVNNPPQEQNKDGGKQQQDESKNQSLPEDVSNLPKPVEVKRLKSASELSGNDTLDKSLTEAPQLTSEQKKPPLLLLNSKRPKILAPVPPAPSSATLSEVIAPAPAEVNTDVKKPLTTKIPVMHRWIGKGLPAGSHPDSGQVSEPTDGARHSKKSKDKNKSTSSKPAGGASGSSPSGHYRQHQSATTPATAGVASSGIPTSSKQPSRPMPPNPTTPTTAASKPPLPATPKPTNPGPKPPPPARPPMPAPPQPPVPQPKPPSPPKPQTSTTKPTGTTSGKAPPPPPPMAASPK